MRFRYFIERKVCLALFSSEHDINSIVRICFNCGYLIKIKAVTPAAIMTASTNLYLRHLYNGRVISLWLKSLWTNSPIQVKCTKESSNLKTWSSSWTTKLKPSLQTLHVYSTLKRREKGLSRHFNVEYTWSVCRDVSMWLLFVLYQGCCYRKIKFKNVLKPLYFKFEVCLFLTLSWSKSFWSAQDS